MAAHRPAPDGQEDRMGHPKQEVFKFPCAFPLKVIVRAGEGVEAEILRWLETMVGPLEEGAVCSRPSRNGAFLAITATFTARSREQLERIYQELKQRPDVLFSI
jgi:putative lipoic acid-binding regulatory protein